MIWRHILHLEKGLSWIQKLVDLIKNNDEKVHRTREKRVKCEAGACRANIGYMYRLPPWRAWEWLGGGAVHRMTTRNLEEVPDSSMKNEDHFLEGDSYDITASTACLHALFAQH